jgi:hypothetical protein
MYDSMDHITNLINGFICNQIRVCMYVYMTTHQQAMGI